MNLVATKNIIGETIMLPSWHPKIILEKHNDELVKRREYKKVRAYSKHDLNRWDLPKEITKTHDLDVQRIIKGAVRHTYKSNRTYFVYNSSLATTAAPVKQPTGSTIRTMMQLAPAAGYPGCLIAWGCSFDGSTAATPGQVEVFENTVAATMSTAFAVADIQPYTDPNTPANTSGGSGVPFNLSTGTSGFATAAVTEGTVAGYRAADLAMLPPTGPYVYQWPLGREFGFSAAVAAARFIRFRMTFGATVNCYIWAMLEF